MSGGVPQLQPHRLSINLHGLGGEVDPHRRLGRRRCTLEVCSKESWMNLEMMEVLPTFWSPTKTTLNLLVRGIRSERFIIADIDHHSSNEENSCPNYFKLLLPSLYSDCRLSTGFFLSSSSSLSHLPSCSSHSTINSSNSFWHTASSSPRNRRDLVLMLRDCWSW